MRMLALVLVPGLVAATTAFMPPRADQVRPIPQVVTLTAVPSDSLVDSYGVGIHLPFLDTPYRDATAVGDALEDLGVRHVRDDLYLRNQRQYAGIRSLASRGVRFDLITGNRASPGTPKEFVDAIAALPAGSVDAIEGLNEWDLFSGGASDWPAVQADWQRQLHAAAKANPATASIPVLAPAPAFRQAFPLMRNQAQYADLANAHTYPGGHPPSQELARTGAAARLVTGGKPLVVTETGYHNAVNTTNGHLPVPEDVAGVYLPRLLLEHVAAGHRRVYSYELIDEFADAERTNPEAGFGLLRRDWTPKPAYTAMKNLLGLVKDPGPAFKAAPLTVGVTGFPRDGKYLLTQKRNGQHVLLLWRDVSVYQPTTKERRAVAPVEVTVELPSTRAIAVHRPSQSAAPVSRTTGDTLSVPLDGSVTAVTLDKVSPPAPPAPVPAPAADPAPVPAPVPGSKPAPGPALLAAPAPQSVTAVAGTARRATVRWSLPRTAARVTGFEVTRNPGQVRVRLPAIARSHTDAGLVNGTRYTFTVRTLSVTGSSVARASRAVVPGARPGRPRVAATGVARGKISVRWSVSAAGGRITAYQVRAGKKVVRVPAGRGQAVLAGLGRKKVRVGVRALNPLGWSPEGYSAMVTPKKPPKGRR